MTDCEEAQNSFKLARKVSALPSEHFRLVIDDLNSFLDSNLHSLSPHLNSNQVFHFESVFGYKFQIGLYDVGRTKGPKPHSIFQIFKLVSDCPNEMPDAPGYFIVNAKIDNEWQENAVMRFGQLDYRLLVPNQLATTNNRLEINIYYAQLPVPADKGLFPLTIESESHDTLTIEEKSTKIEEKSTTTNKKEQSTKKRRQERKSHFVLSVNEREKKQQNEEKDPYSKWVKVERKTKKKPACGLYKLPKKYDLKKTAVKTFHAQFIKSSKVDKGCQPLRFNKGCQHVQSDEEKSVMRSNKGCQHVQLDEEKPVMRFDKGCSTLEYDSDSSRSSIEFVDVNSLTHSQIQSTTMPDLVEYYEAELNHHLNSKCSISTESDQDQEEEESKMIKSVECYEAELHSVFSIEQRKRVGDNCWGRVRHDLETD